jgi:hypothetical protein
LNAIFLKWKTTLAVVLFLLASNAFGQEGEVAEDSKIQGHSISKAPKRIHRSKLIRERLSFAFGAFYSQGEYGTDKNTNTFSIPLRLSYSRNDWRISAQMPFSFVDGPASVIAIRDGVEVVEKIAIGQRQRGGNGDLRISAQHQLYTSRRRESGSYAGTTVKVPIASEAEGLGSGEFDYSFFVGGYLRYGSWVANGRVGYQLMGDREETDYQNRWYASFGGRYRIDRYKSIGASAYYKQRSIDTSDSIQSLTSYFNLRMNDGWRMSLSLGTGFTESTSDLFGGIQFTKSFVRKRRVISSN